MPAFDSPLFTLLFGALMVASVVMAVRQRDALFDATYTADDRTSAMRLALFVLLPLSVLLHEAGHAVAVLAYGGDLVGFGFFFIAGYVEYVGAFTPLQHAITAAAGTVVNVILGLIAISFFWFRPSKHPAINDMLFTFVGLQLLNSLVVYPLLDVLGFFTGDWSVIYSRDTPVFSLVFAALHTTLLIAAALLWHNPGFRVGHAQRTESVLRLRARIGATGPTAGPGASQQPTASQTTEAAPAADPESLLLAQVQRDALLVAAALAIEGWKHPVDLSSGLQGGGAQVVLRWESDGFQRALLAHATAPPVSGAHLEVHAAVKAAGVGDQRMPQYQRELLRMDGYPEAQELAPYLSRFMAYVDTWDGTVVISPN